MNWLFRRKALEPVARMTRSRPRMIIDPAERELALHFPQGAIVMIDDVDVEFARSTLASAAMRVREALVASLMHEPRDREAHRRLLANFHACGAAIEKIDAETPQPAATAALPRAATIGDVLRAAGQPLNEPDPGVAAAIEAATGLAS
jgi:hypothetical protein